MSTSSNADEVDIQPELRWDEYFMSIAILAAKRSKLEAKEGAVIVTDDNKIVGFGYNGTPLHHPDSPGTHLPVVEAVANAVLFHTGELKGATIYTTRFPSEPSAVLIVQTRINQVHYLAQQGQPSSADTTAVKDLLGKGGVELVRQYIPSRRDVVVNFAAFGEVTETTETIRHHRTSDASNQ